MENHAQRDHATWSASATERNWNCPGSLAMTAHLPETTSEAADWGTGCHQLAEKCFKQKCDADVFIGTIEKGKVFENEVDEEMAETAQLYVDYVRSKSEGCTLLIEQRFSLSALNPPFDAGGTADAVIYNEATQHLEVVDLKGGRGVVDVTENKQLRTYALGAMLATSGLAVQTVTSTIVQPRATHKDGRVRSETYLTAELLEWTTDLIAAMRKAKAAWDAKGSTIEAVWTADHLNAGNHCTKTFCKAAGFCPAYQKKVYDIAGVWFDDTDQPQLANAVNAQDPDEISKALDAADMIEGWLRAVRAYAKAQARSGVAIPNYQLSEHFGREKWVDDEAVAQVAKVAKSVGLSADAYLNPPKLKTPKQVRKAFGKKASLPAELSYTPTLDPNLVRVNITSRAAMPSLVDKFFNDLDEKES
jgi:Protein of unknown function (DUF2800)